MLVAGISTLCASKFLSLWTRILKVSVRAMGLMEQNPIVAGFKVLNVGFFCFCKGRDGLEGQRMLQN